MSGIEGQCFVAICRSSALEGGVVLDAVHDQRGLEDDGSWLCSGDLLHLEVGESGVRDGGEELKATCLLFFWKKLVIVAWAVSWSLLLVDVLELGRFVGLC